MYYGHLGTNQKCSDYQCVLIFQVILYDKVSQLSVWIMQVSLFSNVHINRFHCIGYLLEFRILVTINLFWLPSYLDQIICDAI